MIRVSTMALLAMSVAVAAAGTPRAGAAATAQPAVFDSESAAQARCPNDPVVWLNTNTGVYHFLSVRRYGHTHRGGYVCKAAADEAGDRQAQGKDR